MSISNHRWTPALSIALAAASLAGIGTNTTVSERGIDRLGQMYAPISFGPLTSVAQSAQGSSAAAKQRDFHRYRQTRNTYRGVPMSVAQGKRVAQKLRNRQRHKKQWKAHVR